MTAVEVNTSLRYNVYIGKGLISRCGELILKAVPACKAAIISDDKVFPIYGEQVKKSLEKSGFDVVEYIFKNGEESKIFKLTVIRWNFWQMKSLNVRI